MLTIGDKTPLFTLQNTNGEEVALKDQLQDSKVLLLFFPLAFSSVCTNELCIIRDNMKMYNSLSTNIFAISVDSFFTLREFKKKNNLNFTLLSDFNKEVSKKYCVLYKDYYGMKGVSMRSAFLINKERIVEYSEIVQDSSQMPDFKAIQKTLLD